MVRLATAQLCYTLLAYIDYVIMDVNASYEPTGLLFSIGASLL